MGSHKLRILFFFSKVRHLCWDFCILWMLDYIYLFMIACLSFRRTIRAWLSFLNKEVAYRFWDIYLEVAEMCFSEVASTWRLGKDISKGSRIIFWDNWVNLLSHVKKTSALIKKKLKKKTLRHDSGVCTIMKLLCWYYLYTDAHKCVCVQTIHIKNNGRKTLYLSDLSAGVNG